jgi:hypothetical protein
MPRRAMEDEVPPAEICEPRAWRQSIVGASKFVMPRLCVVHTSRCWPAQCCILLFRRLLAGFCSGLDNQRVDTARPPAPGGTTNQDGMTRTIAEQRPKRQPRGSRTPAGGNF